MDNTKKGKEMLKYMELVESISLDAKEMKKGGNTYNPKEALKILNYVQKFIKMGSQKSSWEYHADWVAQVTDTMKKFLSLRKGDPALKYMPASMVKDMRELDYGSISFGKAAKGVLGGKEVGPKTLK